MRYTCRGLLVLSVGLSCAAAGADELTTTAGKKLAGTVVAVDPAGVTFRTGESEAEVKVPAKEILLVDLGRKVVAPAKDAKYQEVELTDGSVLRCERFRIKGKKFELDLLPGPADTPAPALDLPLAAVSHALRGAENPKHKDDWRKMLQNRGKRDLYVTRQGDALNFIQGTLLSGNEAGDRVTFEQADGQKSALLLSRATGGLVFNQPPQPRVPPTVCKVLDVFGNALVAQAVEFAGSGVKVKTVSGAEVAYPSAAAVAKLDYGQGNVAYLSDLEPAVAAPDREPGDPRLTYIKDQTQQNEPLRLDNVAYPKGLWVYGDTSLTFNLGGDYREFKAVVGLDDTVMNAASGARLTLEADGRVLFAEVLRRKDKPKELTLDVRGVKQLRVTVEPDAPYNGCQVILADARVQK